jgi:hypothetical protein
MPSKSRSKSIARDLGWLGPAIAPGEILLEEFLKPIGLVRSRPPAASTSRSTQ